MKILFSIFVVLLVLAGNIPAQDPVKAAPDSYKQQFENEFVRVLRVRYAPRSKVVEHDHSRAPAAYIYLNDAGPVHFTHAHWDDPVLTRRPVTAGTFRLSPTRAGDETHAVENPSETESNFLRIEFKYLPVAKTTIIGRFPRERFDEARSSSKIHFDDQYLRVTRHIVAPGQEVRIAASKTEPALLAVVFADKTDLSAGETIWLAPGQQRSFKNVTGGRLELLRFELKKTGR